MEDEEVTKALGRLTLKNADDEEMTYSSHRQVEPARRQVMATAFPELGAAAVKAFAVVAMRGDGETKEFIAIVKDGDGTGPLEDPQLVMGSCQITYEDLTPSECIEYCFPEAPEDWAMAQLSQGALEQYRGMKFEAWKGMLVSPTCEAQFRRMLQIGPISQMYDPQVFPTPEAFRSKYQVTDEKTGKTIQLPHPVKAMRVWNAGAQAYKPVETQLTGAPAEGETAAWWESFVQELSEKHGSEYITGLAAGK